MSEVFDVAVVGAGFFGSRLSLLLARLGLRVVLIEKSSTICGRASYVNQARVHNGYHYPRSYSTALGSSKHYEQFCSEMSECIVSDFDHIYAIGRGSYTSAYQFQKFCQALSLPVRKPEKRHRALFANDRIEDLFLVREAAFNAAKIRESLGARIAGTRHISTMWETNCNHVDLGGDVAVLNTSRGTFSARGVFLVAYAETNTLLRNSGIQPIDLKAEFAELCIVDVPPALRGIAVTVMDGPFFSCMPMPAEQAYSFTHVRYTPRFSWNLRTQPESPYEIWHRWRGDTRFPYMRRDAELYMPKIAGLRHRHSLYEVKAIPNRHETDDGRPILLRVHSQRPFCVSVLGSKLDSVFELEEAVSDSVGDWLTV